MLSFTSTLALTAITSFIIGVGVKTLLNRTNKREEKLKSELSDTKEKLNSFQSDVNTHFEKTANLFNKLSVQYKELYEHLDTSSKKLCDSDVITPLLAQQTSGEKWRKLVVDSDKDTQKTDTSDKWHPTYVEAREAGNADLSDEHDELGVSSSTNSLNTPAEKTKAKLMDQIKDPKYHEADFLSNSLNTVTGKSNKSITEKESVNKKNKLDSKPNLKVVSRESEVV